MARDRCSVLGLCLFVAYAFWGCASLRPSSQDAPMPFFAPSAEDASRLVLMTHELDEKARQCVDPVKCEQVSFARALVSLFESGDAARTSFRHLIERNFRRLGQNRIFEVEFGALEFQLAGCDAHTPHELLRARRLLGGELVPQ